MKKIVALFFAVAMMVNSFAAFTVNVPPALKASQINMPVGKTGKTISLLELSTMRVKEYQTLSGQDMKFMDKVAFKMTQRELKKVIKTDGTVDVKKLEVLNKKIQKAADAKGNLRMALIFTGIAVVLSILGAFVPFVFILASIAWLVAVVFFILWLINMAA